MSTSVVNLQAQVESVLGALVKAATVELTKLFESRYGATTALEVDAGRNGNIKENETLKSLDCSSAEDTKRSIGVQVDGDIYRTLDLCDGDCKRECTEEEKETVVEGPLFPPEDNGQVDHEWSPPKEQVVAEIVDTVELSGFEEASPSDSEPQTEVVLHGTWTKTLNRGSMQSSPLKQKPLVIQPDKRNNVSGKKVKFVCPLILKPESPASKPDGSEKPAQAEPQQACVSTAKGTAYSPSPSDGAVTPAQVGVWERIHTPTEMKNDLHMRLKLTSPDKKLMRPCAVQLVNVLTVSESDMRPQDEAAKDNSDRHKCGWPLPKDLRPHQGLHTGHRLCCFTPCGNGVWRLHKVVARTRDGYACSICRKTFKRRKILRRHERFHTGEKPYSCSTCSKTFALRKSLRRHVRFHTGERPHTCTQCSKSFRLRDNLKAHLRFHTGEKPFSCTTCGKMFRIMRNMEKHRCGLFVPSFRTIAGL